MCAPFSCICKLIYRQLNNAIPYDSVSYSIRDVLAINDGHLEEVSIFTSHVSFLCYVDAGDCCVDLGSVVG